MKKLIAGTALVATLLAGGTVAFAETSTDTTAQTTTQSSTQADATAQTTATATTQAETATTAQAEAATTTAEADAEVQLPEVSLTPDKLFYSLKLFLERLQLALTMDAIAKGEILEQQAETRLAEAKAMADAGRMDLAQQSLAEAKAKLAAAQKQVSTAMTADRDVTRLTAELREVELKFATVLGMALESAPENVKDQMEPVVAEMLAQVAVQPVQPADAVTTEEPATEEAQAAEHEIYTRKELLLKAMARASGKSPDEVQRLFAKNPGLGRIAKALGVKMGDVQHATQQAWKAQQAGLSIESDSSFETRTLPESVTEAALESATSLEARIEAALQSTKQLQAETGKQHDGDDDDRDDREEDHEQSKGKGQGKEKHEEKKSGKH